MQYKGTIKSIKSAETDEDLFYCFRRISNRKFESALELLEQASTNPVSKQEKREMFGKSFSILVEGDCEKILDEATRADLQEIISAAIKFNQVGPDDEKKSE